jgi:hypothetical protein
MPDHRQARGDGRREKDRNFVAALVRSSLVDRDTIHSRLASVDERYRPAAEVATSWLRSL